MRQTMQNVLKYNDNVYSSDTIANHRKHLKQNDKVIREIRKSKPES